MNRSSGQLLDEGPSGRGLVDLWHTLQRYRLFIAGMTTISALVAVIYAMWLPEIYRAEAVVREVADNRLDGNLGLPPQIAGLSALAGINLRNYGSGMSEGLAVLKSRGIAESFINQSALQDVLTTGEERGTLWFATEKLRNDVVSFEDDPVTGLTRVVVEWTDPVQAAAWANELVSLTNESARNKALSSAQRKIDYLNSQIEATKVIELRKVLYSLLENETKTMMLANADPEYALSIIDPAVPPEMRSRPRRTLLVVIGVFAGIFGAMFIVFVKDGIFDRPD